jgi:hypothetical protein
LKLNNCEICKRSFPSLDTHHIQSTSLDGVNKEWNKCYICPSCHRLVHLGKIILEGRFRTTKGNTLIYREQKEESITQVKDPRVWLIGKERKYEE